MDTVDLLAVVAHPDDAELTCGGVLAKAAKAGHRVGILDLTRGELGTRGTAEIRAGEARAAREGVGVAGRERLGLRAPDIVNDLASGEKVVAALRRLRPRVVIAPAIQGRHPDHIAAAQLARDASFLSGLAKYAPQSGAERHRPVKVLHALAYRHDFVRPS